MYDKVHAPVECQRLNPAEFIILGQARSGVGEAGRHGEGWRVTCWQGTGGKKSDRLPKLYLVLAPVGHGGRTLWRTGALDWTCALA